MSFADLKKQSKLGSLTAKLVKEVEKMNNSSNPGDERLWKLECDKSGNGYAVVRFLPAPNGEDLPFVKLYSHAFQGPGGWYIENSLTTMGRKDPVSEYNSILWNNGTDAGKELARKQKRKLTYIANIYVVKDPANPENEGKVFLYKFGKKIFDKLTTAMQPEFEDEEAIDPFDFWQGANFKLKAKNVAGYRNYDSSEFARSSALLDDDDAMEGIWKKQYSLSELVANDQFKTYDELKKRMNYVLGNKGTPKFQDQESIQEEEEFRQQNRGSSESMPQSMREELNSLSDGRDFNSSDITKSSTEDDDTLSYFAKLAED